MFSNVRLSFTADINSAIYSSRVGKVLYIGESMQQLPEYFIPCSILLPPFNALNAEIDGNMQAYKEMYFSYLCFNIDCFEMIGTILAALYKGINVTLYVENGNELSHMSTLMEYFAIFHGIYGSSDASPRYAYDISFSSKNAAILYNFYDGFISAYTMLGYMPNSLALLEICKIQYCDRTITKLVQELQINPNSDVLSVLQSIINDMRVKADLQAFIMIDNNGKKLSLVSFEKEDK